MGRRRPAWLARLRCFHSQRGKARSTRARTLDASGALRRWKRKSSEELIKCCKVVDITHTLVSESTRAVHHHVRQLRLQGVLHTWPAQDVHAFLHFSRSYSRAGASRFAADWSTAQHRLLHSGTQCVAVASATICSDLSGASGVHRTREKSVTQSLKKVNNRRRATCATRPFHTLLHTDPVAVIA